MYARVVFLQFLVKGARLPIVSAKESVRCVHRELIMTISRKSPWRRMLLSASIATIAGAMFVIPARSEKSVGMQGLTPADSRSSGAVYVEPIDLTEVYDKAISSLNIGAVVADRSFAAGLQKGADVWGINLDLFIVSDRAEQTELLSFLIDSTKKEIIIDADDIGNIEELRDKGKKFGVEITAVELSKVKKGERWQVGFNTFAAARARIAESIPKYDEILPIAFPISPMPDSFFQATKFPYPSPVVRVPRTAESISASAHAHASCNMVAQTGNMLHRTSSIDPDVFLMGMEGGNLSLRAMPGAVDPEKVSAVMTSWVIAVRGENSLDRDILVENDGVGSSFFKPAAHAPEELKLVLDDWRHDGVIGDYLFQGDQIKLLDYEGADRTFLAGMFLIAVETPVSGAAVIPGIDYRGRRTFDFYSTQNFAQQFVEIVAATELASYTGPSVDGISNSEAEPIGEPLVKWEVKPVGGVLTAGGASVGNTVGESLGGILQKVPQEKPEFQPYVMAIEGGFLVVTPERSIDAKVFESRISRIEMDLRGPLTSDQTVTVTLEDGSDVVFRRTALNFNQIDDALDTLRQQAMVSGWEYDGSRGRGLNANLVLTDFLGKHRKFMSTLSVWPTEEKPDQPVTRFYVDGMQRLNFSFISTKGWRQEFVEVPLKVPPVPRDIELYSDISTLN